MISNNCNRDLTSRPLEEAVPVTKYISGKTNHLGATMHLKQVLNFPFLFLKICLFLSIYLPLHLPETGIHFLLVQFSYLGQFSKNKNRSSCKGGEFCWKSFIMGVAFIGGSGSQEFLLLGLNGVPYRKKNQQVK